MPEQELSIAPAAQSPCYIPPSTAVGLDYFSIGTLLQAGYAFVVGPLGFAKQCCAPHWFSCAAMVLQPFRFFVWSSQVFSTDVFFFHAFMTARYCTLYAGVPLLLETQLL
jgi:hypothetical protein